MFGGSREKQPPPSSFSSRREAPPRQLQLQPCPSPKELIFANLSAVSPHDVPSRDGGDVYLLINGTFVVSARPHPQVQPGQIGLNDFMRTWMRIALTDIVAVEQYDPFRQGDRGYLGKMDIEVGFAGNRPQACDPIDQDELANAVTKVFRNQIFAPGQSFGLDYRGPKLKLTVRTVELVDLTSLKSSSGQQQETAPHARGILTPETAIDFFKDAKSTIQLKGSTKRAAGNSIIRPDFKFEDLGIGGLDVEFSAIFRRAFASRILPPGIVEKLGIQHVRGLLLYGPPGTGKTLIARQIGKMLNAREPKVINGPEVLNKFVGQSEENIRKLFADAEKEQKEKGDESGLHIIIFDELDAVCKQRGSGAGGGTGVGDSVVNQLLSKLDGVEQLNNVLLIGMTNRKDMIDEALLRAGRLEVHMEINLPDEHGRGQILKIHTAKMRGNDKLARDVDLADLAHRTRNFSGAELSGLVKAASSFALQRHIKGGTVAALTDDINTMQIHQADFITALDEVKPLFGASEEDLDDCVSGGIMHYGPQVASILEDAGDLVKMIRSQSGTTRVHSVLLHGPKGSGKTALAAQIALDSQFPLMKLVSSMDISGMNEQQKIQHLTKVFTDAYKSPLNLLVLDEIEQIIEWVPVGPRFSSAVLNSLKVLIKNRPPKGRPLLIIATTSEKSVMSQLQMSFDSNIAVPNLQSQAELAHVMQESGKFDQQSIPRIIGEIEETTGSKTIGVGIKKILSSIEEAMQREDHQSRFAELIASAVTEAAYA